MAFTFDSTIKGTTANSYVSVQDADDYFGGSIFSSVWTELTTEEREQHLVSATNRLEAELYAGLPTTDTQSLSMPRQGLYSVEGDKALDEDTIPYSFQKATYELALAYVQEYKNESPMFSQQDMERMSKIDLGPISADLRKTTEHALPNIVKRYLKSVAYLFWKGSSPFIPAVRV